MINEREIKLLTALQPVFREKMGVLREGDKYLVPNGNIYIWMSNTILMSDVIRIPLAIDTENPERGLWGMIDWDDRRIHVFKDGSVQLTRSLGDILIHRGNPYEALLRALASQEGME